MKFGALSFAVLVLLVQTGISFAQPVIPTSPVTDLTADQHAEIKTNVAETKADIKMSAATREQIQALRLALRAKLAAMRH
jgi:hypothetical protein